MADDPATTPARNAAKVVASAQKPLPGRSFSIDNAGQVLAAPYLPRLFTMLNLLEDGRFATAAHARRACRLLQFMVDGRGDAPASALLLNKLLCGLDADAPLDGATDHGGMEITDDERQRCPRTF